MNTLLVPIVTVLAASGAAADVFSRLRRLPRDAGADETDVELRTGVPLSYMVGTRSYAYRMVRGGDWEIRRE